ncbi:MAG: methyltransferase domain-containing protein [Selenomonadaceae bacterium]|nr:methyltransferase domain-containing protein [Selenomonadaceae bacterium]
MPIINFPPTFDPNYYRRSYPELNFFPDGVLIEHYKRFAIERGHSTCAYDRQEHLKVMLQDVVENTNLKFLEISPWDNPLIYGNNVKYFSTADSETLKKIAVEKERPFNNVPEKIDFISSNGNLDIIEETFDIVVSSHVIEHCPDLIKHLQSVSRILHQGGLYILIIPDKRYCFDHYQPESTIEEVIDAFVAERKFPRLSKVIKLFTDTHNYAIRHWLGDHGERNIGYQNEESRERLLKEIEKYLAALKNDEYIDTHNWQFIPDSFGYIISLLKKLGFIDLSLYRLCHTVFARFEFIAVLEKN